MTAYAIDGLLDLPFFTGSASASPAVVPWVLPCSIGSHAYMIDFAKYRRTTLQIRRLSSDESVEPGEQTLNATGVWPRAQDNWFLGAGQKFLDNRFAFESVYVHSGEYPSVRTRFWKSQGLDPWDEGHLTLLPEYESIATSSTNICVIACGTYLYKTDGAHLYYTDNPTTGVPTWTEVTTSNTNTIVSLATDGSRVWFACGSDGVYVTTAGSSSASAAATPAALTAPQGVNAIDGTGTVNATNLPNGSTVFYITAVDAFGNETNYTSVTHTVASLPVELTWNAQGAASDFKVYRGTKFLTKTGDVPSFTDDGSIAGTSATAPSTNGTGSEAYPATFLLYAKGHLIGSTGRDIVEILATGSVSFIFQHENPDFVWTCGCETPTAILVGGYAGGISYVGSIQPDSATNGATLAPPIWATALPPGESINAIAYSAGSILMGTSSGVRSGTRPDASGVFDVSPVIEDPGNCQCIAPWTHYEYFGWSDYDPTESWISRPTVSGLGRADLAQYTTSGVPGYATDVMSTISGSVTAVTVLAGVPYFVVDNAGSWSLWGPDGKRVESGWMEPGWVRYGTIEPKIVVELFFQNEPLPSGASINFKLVDETYTVTDIGTLATFGATTVDDPLSTGLAVGNRFQPIITLNAGTGQTEGPDVVSWVSKALVVPRRQDEILLPIILKTEVATGQPADEFYNFNTLEEYLYLKSIESSGAPVTHTLGTDTHQCYIDQIMVGDTSTEMNDDRTWLNTIIVVKLLTLS